MQDQVGQKFNIKDDPSQNIYILEAALRYRIPGLSQLSHKHTTEGFCILERLFFYDINCDFILCLS